MRRICVEHELTLNTEANAGDRQDQGTALQKHLTDILCHLKLLRQTVERNDINDNIDGALCKTEMNRFCFLCYVAEDQADYII